MNVLDVLWNWINTTNPDPIDTVLYVKLRQVQRRPVLDGMEKTLSSLSVINKSLLTLMFFDCDEARHWYPQTVHQLGKFGDDIVGMRWTGSSTLRFYLNGSKRFEISPFELQAPYITGWFNSYAWINFDLPIPTDLEIKWVFRTPPHN